MNKKNEYMSNNKKERKRDRYILSSIQFVNTRRSCLTISIQLELFVFCLFFFDIYKTTAFWIDIQEQERTIPEDRIKRNEWMEQKKDRELHWSYSINTHTQTDTKMWMWIVDVHFNLKLSWTKKKFQWK